MNLLNLTHETGAEFAAALASDRWIVACLCARWCDLCEAYRSTFSALAARHPVAQFVWIDIEDQAELVGDMEVENFPTLLIQRSDVVAFFGPVLPDLRIADGILASLAHVPLDALRAEVMASAQKRRWQGANNLRSPFR